MDKLIAWMIPDAVLRAYFCHRLPAAGRRWLERMYFWTDILFERIESAELDLINDYVGGRLSPRERQAFEQHYLITESRRDKVALAKDLAESWAESIEISTTRNWRGYLAWVSAAVVISVSILVVLRWPTGSFNVPIDSRSVQRKIRNSGPAVSPLHIPRNARTVILDVHPTLPTPGEWAVTARVNRNPIFNATVVLNAQGALLVTIPRDRLSTGLLAIECRSRSSPKNMEEFRIEIDLN